MTTIAITPSSQQLDDFCRKFGVEEISVFGSVLREDFRDDSDIDLMLKFKAGHGFTFENTPEIQDALERIFGRRVDVIEKGRIRTPSGVKRSWAAIGCFMPLDPRQERRDAAWLLDMLTAARAVQTFVAGRTFEQYEADLMFRSAVERQVEIIGEAARGISDEFQVAHPEIPWRPIMAQRHRLAHEYGEIDDKLIWTVATVHVPALILLLERLVDADR